MSAELPLEDDENTSASDAEAAPAYEAEPQADWPPASGDRYGREESAQPADPNEEVQAAAEPRFAPAEEQTPAETEPGEYDALPSVEPSYRDDFSRPAPAADREPAASDPFGGEPPAAAEEHWQPDDFGRQPAAARQAAAAPEAEVAPPVITNGMYTVQPGDTLWSISEKVYGTGGYFKALAAHNRASLPRSDQLTVGGQVAVPSMDELERDYPSLCPKQRNSALVPARTTPPAAARRRGTDVYVVAEGDTLFDIARYELGKASRWAEIYKLNRDVLGEDFDYLRPGTELVMPPPSGPAAEVSRAGGSRYQ